MVMSSFLTKTWVFLHIGCCQNGEGGSRHPLQEIGWEKPKSEFETLNILILTMSIYLLLKFAAWQE